MNLPIEQLLAINILLSVCILVVVLLPYLLMLFSLILAVIVTVVAWFGFVIRFFLNVFRRRPPAP